MAFKKGDLVECINDLSLFSHGQKLPYITKGKTYKIVEANDRDVSIEDGGDIAYLRVYRSVRFKLVSDVPALEPEKPKPPVPELPAEVWRGFHGLDRNGVDYMGAVRQSAEATRRKA